MNVLNFLFLFIFSSFAQAQSDYMIEGLGISYPLGAYIKGEYGHSVPIWRGSGVLYGFTRASGTLKSSGKINSGSGKIELYPISILGLYAERSYSARKSDELPTFDCGTVTCENSMVERNTVGFRFAFKVSGLYLMSDNKRTGMGISGSSDRLIADEQTTLIAGREGDRSLQNLVTLGYDFSEGFSLGVLYKHNQMERNKNQSNLAIAFSRLKFGETSLFLGAGVFRDRNVHHHPTLLLILKWIGSEGLQLF